MNKKSIILADNSYTIRRIVELSFSDEEEIELISFENGSDLKEKLVEIKPSVVLVDIKLPELNGYEVCQFINETETVKDTKIFLLKGGFEPIDEELLKTLTYVDIITKPFDSNALVDIIKNELSDTPSEKPEISPEDIPSQVPEELPEITDSEKEEGEFDFADIKDDLDSEDFITKKDDQKISDEPREEITPSEEITESGRSFQEDSISPESGEEIENPFKDEDSPDQEKVKPLKEEELNMKENIAQQEKELDISSLTQEELQIKKQIEVQETMPEDDVEQIKSEIKDDLEEIPEESKEEIPLITEKKDEGEILKEKEIEIEKTEPVSKGAETFEPPEEHPEEKTAKEIEIDRIEQELKKESEATEKTIPEEEMEKSPEDLIPEREPVEKADDQQEISKPDTDDKTSTTKVKVKKELKKEKIKSEKKVGDTEIEIPSIHKDEIMSKVEDKLIIAIKEILWEITPSLAEKIIKEEIEKIKSDLNNSSE